MYVEGDWSFSPVTYNKKGNGVENNPIKRLALRNVMNLAVIDVEKKECDPNKDLCEEGQAGGHAVRYHGKEGSDYVKIKRHGIQVECSVADRHMS